MQNTRTIVVGDIHGCREELEELLKLVSFRQGVDRMAAVGDLEDRGPDSPGVVRMFRENAWDCTLGNHDEKHARWARYEARRVLTGEKNPMRAFPAQRLAEHNALSDDDRHYLANLPPYIRFEDGGKQWIITHAGIPTNAPIEKQDVRTLVRVRHVNKDTGAYCSTGNPRETPPNSVLWTEKWRGPESVIYGHIVQEGGPKIEEPAPGVLCVGVDTGCCFGGMLTAAVFMGQGHPTFYHVPAKRTYWSKDVHDE